MLGFNELDREVLEIELQSPIFNGMREQLGEAIQEAFEKVFNKEFEAGEIALKLSVSMPETYKEIPVENRITGEIVKEKKPYRYPRLKFTVTTNFKKKNKAEGQYVDCDRKIELDDDVFIIKKVEDAQMRMSL